MQVAGQVFDHAFAPAVLLLALGNKLAPVPIQLHLLLVDLLKGAVYWASRTRCLTAASSWW
nr:hypothetical protein [Hymenobacter nivis]